MKKLLLCFAALAASASIAIAAPNKDGTQKDQVVIPAMHQATTQNSALISPSPATAGFADMYALHIKQTQNVTLEAENIIATPGGGSSSGVATTKSEVMPLAAKDSLDCELNVYVATGMTKIGDSGVSHIRILPNTLVSCLVRGKKAPTSTDTDNSG